MQKQNIKKHLTMLTIAISAVVMFSGVTAQSAFSDPNEKVAFCHIEGKGVGNTIEISINAMAAHYENHENDHEGECTVDESTDTDSDGISNEFDACPTDATNTCNNPIDTTAPQITENVVCSLPGNAGWCRGDVTVNWIVSDPDSQISSKTGCDSTLITTDVSNNVLTCTATSQGGTNTISVVVNRDATTPEISSGSQSPEANVNGWNNVQVDVAFTCTDALSGPVSDDLESLVAEGENQSATGQCEDLAGNTSSATYEGINIDLTAPIVSTLANSGIYILGQPVSVSCEDTLSGLASCEGNLDTSNPGANTQQITASDLAGNVATPSVAFQVNYDLACGAGSGSFMSPVPNTQYKSGRVVPEKFIACDYDGNRISSVIATSFVGNNPATSPGSANTDNFFRYDVVDMQYIFNMNSKGLPLGDHVLKAVLDSGQEISSKVKFTK